MIRRVAFGLFTAVALLLLVGFVYELLAQRYAERQYDPLGQRVDVGGRSVHVHCVGSGDPTVVVEAGSGSWSLDWLQAQALLAEEHRVCTYDRAGYGWSDPAPDPPTAERITTDLRRALDAAGVDEPFVLMGHSLGGLYARAYALVYPQDVVGLVLVDSRHEDVNAMLPEALVEQERQMRRVYGLAQVLARFGIVRALGPALLPSPGLPEEQAEVFWAQATRPRFFGTVQAEIDAIGQVEQRVRGATYEVPVVVVRHGAPGMFGAHPDAKEAEEAWRRSQEDLLTSSEDAVLLVAEESGHNIHLEQPEVLLEAVQAVEAFR